MWPFGRSTKTSSSKRPFPAILRARYDAAVTNDDNRRHWLGADGLSASTAASVDVRRILRNRSRYEVANNSYARGIVLTLANDCIGTGPRLQMLTDSAETNQSIEREFAAWARAIDLPGKLRTMRQARAQDGETFAVLFSNDNLSSAIKLDLRIVEADQVATPPSAAPHRGRTGQTSAVDGIVLDSFGNPQEYHVLKDHPGSGIGGAVLDFDRVPARSMIQWFRADRPGQYRGLPDILPALPLFAQLRRYTLAVIAAAETAADFAAVLFTDSPANGEAQTLEPMDVVELEKRMATVLPDGWRLGQLEAQQPTTTYGEFKREILNEIARCLNMPYNIAACNSSGYNYASGRLDHQTYYKSIHVEQSHCETVVLDRILAAWLAEAVKVFGIAMDESVDASHQWFWDGHEHVDPAKEANAQATRLANNTTTLATEYARQGKDWETELRQRAKEVQLCKELGLTVAQAAPGPSQEQVKEDEDEEQPQSQAA